MAMAEVLSQSQIDELLNSFKDVKEIEVQAPEKKIKAYDFKAPKKFTKEQIKVLDGIFENYTRLLSSYLTSILRLYCKVSLVQIEEQRYYEFNNALPDYVMMGMVDMGIADPDISETTIIIQMSNPITFAMIDRLLGGTGAYIDEGRDFTEIEVDIMEGVLGRFSSLLRDPWLSYIDTDPKLVSIETNSRVIQAIASDDVAIIVMLEAEINDIKNTISVCLPAINLEEIMAKFSGKYMRSSKRLDPTKDEERRQEILTGIKDTQLEITAVLGETQVDLGDILNLQVNDVIPLNLSIDSNVMVRIGESAWFDGKLGVRNNRKAVKIDNILRN